MKRIYEKLLNEYLGYFPCVAVIGPRQCGKTTLIKQLPKTWKLYDLEKNSDFQVISQDPDLFLRLNNNNVAMDEVQLYPKLFSALRVAIDDRRNELGRFVITGSSSPLLLNAISESLAGRVGIIEMGPFTYEEINEENNKDFNSPFFSYLAKETELNEILNKTQEGDNLKIIHEYWLKGGYPEPWLKQSQRFRQLWMDNYRQTYLYRDIANLFPGLNREKYRLFIDIIAGLSGSVINYADVARALGVSQPTAREYFRIADATFLWRYVPAFEKNAFKRIVKHPKGHLRDSGLLHHILRISDLNGLLTHPQMGKSWESMVIEEIIRGCKGRGLSFDYYYYRTGAGAEVDLVLDGEFGLIPIEIKYTQTVSKKHLRSINDFINERNCRIGFVINNDQQVRFYNDKILGIPFYLI